MMRQTTLLLCVFLLISLVYGIDDSCSFCPDGRVMSNPHHVLPNSLTCIEFQEFVLADLSPDECEAVHTAYRETTSIDMLAFCGCLDSPPPDLCPFCEGAVSFPAEVSSLTTNDGNERTCSDLAQLAPYVADPDYCLGHVQFFENMCCPPPGQNEEETTAKMPCSVCPLGSYMMNPSRDSGLFGGRTCQSMDSELFLVPEGSCTARRLELSHGLDLAAFCGCTGVGAPSIFTFCELDDAIALDPVIDVSATRSGQIGMTCQEAVTLAPYFWTLDEYGRELGPLASACCKDTTTCALCADGSSVQFPERPLDIGKTRPTCEGLDNGLRKQSFGECPDIHQRNSPIDYESWCGCTNAAIPDKCALCGEGFTLTNENVQIPDTNGMTCGDAAELARHVVDVGFCSDYLSMLSGECCTKEPEKTWSGNRFPQVYVVSEANSRGAFSLFGIFVIITTAWMLSLW